MTAVQTARTQGFRASLSKRGVTLKLLPSGPSLPALIDATVPLMEGGFAVVREERVTCIVSILRVDIATVSISIGDTFENEDTDDTFRVTEIKDQPIDIAVKFTCEPLTP